MTEQYLKRNVQFHLAEKLSRAVGEYLDGTGDYPVDVKYMPLAEYLVDEVLDDWVGDYVTAVLLAQVSDSPLGQARYQWGKVSGRRDEEGWAAAGWQVAQPLRNTPNEREPE